MEIDQNSLIGNKTGDSIRLPWARILIQMITCDIGQGPQERSRLNQFHVVGQGQSGIFTLDCTTVNHSARQLIGRLICRVSQLFLCMQPLSKPAVFVVFSQLPLTLR